jgi:hypothetical protein
VTVRTIFPGGIGGRRLARSSVALAALAAGWLSLGVAVAAAEPHPKIGEFGAFTNPNGIAVDESDGAVYVADIGADEQQTIAIEGGPTAGSFTLEFEGERTSALNLGGASAPTAGEVESALSSLTSIGSANVAVSEMGELPGTVAYTVTFQGALASRDVPSLACDGTALSGGTSPKCSVTTAVQGVEGRVEKFDASGAPIDFFALGDNQLTGLHTPASSFSFPTNAYGTPAAIAVDNSKLPSDPSVTDLYVMDAGHGVIDKFSPSGEYLSQIAGFAPATGSAEGELLGLAVDANGSVRADLSTGRPGEVAIDEFDNSSANRLYARQANQKNFEEFGSGAPNAFQEADGFAVGPTGDDYLLYRSCSCTLKLGQQLSALGKVDGPGAGDVALASDPATGHLYAENGSSLSEWDTGAMNGSSTNPEGEPQSVGVHVGDFGSLSVPAGQGGIAVDGASGTIYVSNPGERDVYVFASAVPAVTADAASDTTKEAATLNGTIDPRGAPIASCKFEYGVADEFGLTHEREGSYEHEAFCQPAAVGAGNSPVPVSAAIEGLQPGLLYRFRLVAGNAGGSSEAGGLLATLGTGFGIKSFDVKFLNKDGTPDTQAGSHPYQLVNDIEFNSRFMREESNADSPYVREPDGTVKDLALDLPPGMVGDPNATAKKCTLVELLNSEGNGEPNCPAETLLGFWQIEYSKHIAYGTYVFDEPIFNMVPPRGVAVQFGVHYRLPDLFINSGVLAGGDYPVQTTVTNPPTAAPVLFSRVTVFGDPNELQAEQLQHKLELEHHGEPQPLPRFTPKAFLTLPTGCHGPLRSTISMDSYQQPGRFVEAVSVSKNSAGAPVSLTGCSKLRFAPTIGVAPDTTNASTASGLTVGVHVPQTAAFNADGLAESSLRDTTVTLPEGVSLNPSGAGGLEACSEGLAGFKGFTEFNSEFEPGVSTATFAADAPSTLQPGSSFCPNGSKIATVKIKTPLLEHELEGAVYLAAQNANPFGSLVAMYMIAEDPISGSLIKLVGEVKLTATGQIVTTFANTPDLPFEDLQVQFFGGERAPLSTPARCGTYTTQAVFTPWDGNGPVTSTSSFRIEHGPGGGPCPGSSLPFDPTLAAGTTNIQAGGFSPFTMTMSREDGQQSLQSVRLKLPPGLSGLLTGVELCPEAEANAGTCSANSLIGETTVSVGVGNDLFTVKGGRVYLTGPYKGAPFGLSIVNPAKAGPYDVEKDASNPNYDPACDCIVVRAKIEVDPITTALTVTSDNEGPYKIPTILDGIPLQIKHVNVTIDRPSFTFDPTDCNPLSITGDLASAEGAVNRLTVPFQATDCARLSFKPRLSVSTSGKTSRRSGASLHVKLTYPKLPFGSQANIAKVKVDLPKQLPSRLSTLQKACVDRVFNVNPAMCPVASKVGSAVATTPLLPVPVRGPAYFVSHGGAKFPELIVVLQGYGVTVDLRSETFINEKTNVTSSTFRAVPDVPVGTFELTLPQGPDSALAAGRNLCKLTRTRTVKRTVVRTVDGHRRRVTRRIKRSVPASLSMPTAFTAQNGVVLHEHTPIAVTGCVRAKKKG